jgi:YD repeat-containing protein
MNESHGRLITQMNGLQVVGLRDSTTINGFISKFDYSGSARTITTTSPLGRRKVTFLDLKGRDIEDSIPEIIPTTNKYNAKGQLIQTKFGNRITTFTYDNIGRLSSIQDPTMRMTSTVYDSAGRVLEQELPDGGNIGFTYDKNGNVLSLTSSRAWIWLYGR